MHLYKCIKRNSPLAHRPATRCRRAVVSTLCLVPLYFVAQHLPQFQHVVRIVLVRHHDLLLEALLARFLLRGLHLLDLGVGLVPVALTIHYSLCFLFLLLRTELQQRSVLHVLVVVSVSVST